VVHFGRPMQQGNAGYGLGWRREAGRRRQYGRRLIRLQRIYNFLCSMLVFTPFVQCFVILRDTFMHFPELTY
jgi:hypothetical protein